MTTAQDVFARHFPGLSPEEVDAVLSRTPAAGATPISAAALGFLAEHGGGEARVAIEKYDEAEVQRDRAVAAAQVLEELLESSWSLELSAGMMGISRSRVSHRISSQTLYAFTLQGRRYVPQWQFVAVSSGERGVEPIPGLARIVPLIPGDLHPLAVRAFMETPREDLDGKSPTTFLVSHGPVEVVEELLVALSHW
jgi:hypothetical protein